MNEQEKIKKALLKKALGFTADEVVFEYVLDEGGEAKLSKKKVTKKHFAPDISAMRVLLEKFYPEDDQDFANMSDEDLLAERKRLIELLKEEEGDGTEKMSV